MTDPLAPRPTEPPPPPAPTWQPPAPAAAPLVLPTVKPKAVSNRLGTYLLGLAVLVAAAGVAFAAGRVTAPAAAAGRTGTNGNFPRGSFGAGLGAGASFAPGGFGGGAALGAGGVSLKGTVTAIDSTTMTLQLTSGQTITIDLPSTTTYHTATTADASAVTTGSSVVVDVTGFGGRAFGGGARSSAAPGASSAASISASDVTVETP